MRAAWLLFCSTVAFAEEPKVDQVKQQLADVRAQLKRSRDRLQRLKGSESQRQPVTVRFRHEGKRLHALELELRVDDHPIGDATTLLPGTHVLAIKVVYASDGPLPYLKESRYIARASHPFTVASDKPLILTVRGSEPAEGQREPRIEFGAD